MPRLLQLTNTLSDRCRRPLQHSSGTQAFSHFSGAHQQHWNDMQLQRTMPTPIISVSNLSKTYASGFQALKSINLEIRRGEIFALLGPNGAGKTTLISIICGIVNPSAGSVTVDGHDIVTRLPRRARDDRPGAAGADHRRLRDACGPPSASAAACSASRRTRPTSRRC